MSILGKIAKGAGNAACFIGGVSIGIAGEAAGSVAKAIGADKNKCGAFIKATDNIGSSVIDASSKVGKFAEKSVDKAFEISGEAAGFIAGTAAAIGGASDETIKKAEKVGKVVGSAALGFVVGDVIGGAVTSIAAGGVASTGTAISSLHGAAASSATLANIGGGALAAGGAGVAGGQAMLAGINVVCAADGANAAGKSKSNDSTP